MKIAIIGSGISGMTAAYYLHPHTDITLFEKEDRLGGHTATMDVTLDGRDYQIDTGFIVYNERTYPNFIRLMSELGVSTHQTSMGFSVSQPREQGGLEYSGANLSTLFAQKRNIFNLSHWKMLKDIVRFNKMALEHVSTQQVSPTMTLGEYLDEYNYSAAFRDYYLIPMGSAIWSASTDVMMNFPLQFFVKFFDNHGLLQIKNRPQWYVISGGSKQYIPHLISPYKDKIRLNSDIKTIKRQDGKVTIEFNDATSEIFDYLVMACHSDEALELLDKPTEAEQEVIGNIAYQNNEVVLHHDTRLLPRNKKTWSSWNYLLHSTSQTLPTLTYNMNILQGIHSPITFCVTLNDTHRIDADKIIERFQFAHPVFTQDAMKSQNRWPELTKQTINEHPNNTWYAGAYWRNGFHEDGVFSGIRAANEILARINKKAVTILDY